MEGVLEEKRLRYGLGDAVFKSQQGQKILRCAELFIQALGSTHPPFQRVMFFPGRKATRALC
jgi:hypothetical protein